MNKSQKRELQDIIVAAILMIGGIIGQGSLAAVVFMVAYLIVGFGTLKKAVSGVLRGQMLDENFLMAIASIGAMILGEYTEGVAVMLFFRVGELFEDYAVNKSRKSIAELMEIRPDYANLYNDESKETKVVDPYDVSVGDFILIKPGEKIPLDGIIYEGSSSVQTAALTGEAIPRDVREGDEVLSGCINMTGLLIVKVQKEFSESTVSKILELVENAAESKANTEKFITKFARVYTPAVVTAAILLAIVPPIVIQGATFAEWVYRAMIFLVISCPCALVISIPLSFFGGIGGASRNGILVKGSNFLEALARVETVVFDKTGTLTDGKFTVTEVIPVNDSSENTSHANDQREEKAKLLRLTAYAESFSDHPISRSIIEAYGEVIDSGLIETVEEMAGYGVKAVVKDEAGKSAIICAGNVRLMEAVSENVYKNAIAQTKENDVVGTIVYVSVDGEYRGMVVISDQIKSDAEKTINELKKHGVKKVAMLTGDRNQAACKIANKLNIDEVYSELLPDGKLEKFERLLEQKNEKRTVVYVGDGINDAPVLARADIGIAMGAFGSDAAISAADAVIMTDEPSKLLLLLKISRKTVAISKQNIVFAIGVKFAVMVIGALGLANMWAAVFADVGVAVIAILNSMRALKG